MATHQQPKSGCRQSRDEGGQRRIVQCGLDGNEVDDLDAAPTGLSRIGDSPLEQRRRDHGIAGQVEQVEDARGRARGGAPPRDDTQHCAALVGGEPGPGRLSKTQAVGSRDLGSREITHLREA